MAQEGYTQCYASFLRQHGGFNFVGEGSTALRVTQSGDNAAPLVLSNIKAPKNGFAYIYLSNESNEPVYFDNFIVSDKRGRIIEENHYYAYSAFKLSDGTINIGRIHGIQ